MVNEEHFPWCRKCRDLHDEGSCPAPMIEKEGNQEDLYSFNSLSFVEEEDFICNIQGRSCVVSSEQMTVIKGKSVDSSKLTKVSGPTPSQEEIKKDS